LPVPRFCPFPVDLDGHDPALQTADDFRQVVVDYAAEAAGLGAVYIEGIFSRRAGARGIAWEAVFEAIATAPGGRERLGVEVNLTPDITRAFSPKIAEETVSGAPLSRSRRGGRRARRARESAEPFATAFGLAARWLGSVPHAGEAAGPASIRGALNALHADRIRHGIRAVEDPALVVELAERGIVLDVTPSPTCAPGWWRRSTSIRCGPSEPRRALFHLDRRSALFATT